MWMLNGQSYQAHVAAPGLFTAEECQKIIKFGADITAQRGVVDGNKIEKIRTSDVKWLRPSDDAEFVFSRISAAVQEINADHFHLDLESMDDFQLTEYDSSYDGHYGQHVDTFYALGGARAAMRKLSVSLQLSAPEEYDGGDLILYPTSFYKPNVVDRAIGTAVFFRSTVIHEVTPVTRGLRRSLVTWVYGPRLR